MMQLQCVPKHMILKEYYEEICPVSLTRYNMQNLLFTIKYLSLFGKVYILHDSNTTKYDLFNCKFADLLLLALFYSTIHECLYFV